MVFYLNDIPWGCGTQGHSCLLSFSQAGHLKAPQTFHVPSFLGVFAHVLPALGALWPSHCGYLTY